MASRPYYSLLTLEDIREGEPKQWCIQFGDYDRAVVAQELEDCIGGWQDTKRANLKIIETGDKQSDIDLAVKRLNALRQEPRYRIQTRHRNDGRRRGWTGEGFRHTYPTEAAAWAQVESFDEDGIRDTANYRVVEA